ncbi:hypothetical protein V5O48_014838 [Marasmius crinis-equi]|uniref:Uncharacterized protein n=1 Tax=Marasmius crinis-equi TaxID=585013 RepID=A0ABR3EW62_9AGAR
MAALWLYYRRNRRRNEQPDLPDTESTVNPFPSGHDAKTRQSRPEYRKLPVTPLWNSLDMDIAAGQHSPGLNLGTPPVSRALEVAGEINRQTRSGIIAGLTTDELVLELNQRIRWNNNETLPEYPGSERRAGQ